MQHFPSTPLSAESFALLKRGLESAESSFYEAAFRFEDWRRDLECSMTDRRLPTIQFEMEKAREDMKHWKGRIEAWSEAIRSYPMM